MRPITCATALLTLTLHSLQAFSQSTDQYQLLYADSTVLFNASQACLTSYNANVSCSSTIGLLYSNPYADLSSSDLSDLCTSQCYQSILSHRSSIAQNCGSSVEYYSPIDGSYLSATALDDEALYLYNLTCLQNAGTYCNTWFQGLDNSTNSTGGGTNSQCNPCYLETILMEAESAFGSGSQGLSSMYSSLSSSCSYTGPTPTAPSQVIISSPSAKPTCTGTTYNIKSGDTYNSVALSQNVSTVQLLQTNGLSYNTSDFPTSGSLCITNTCAVHVLQANDTCSALASSAGITTVQLSTWNPAINGLCSNLGNMTSQTICLTNPWGTSNSTATLPPSVTTATTAAPIPPSTAPNVTTDCGEYYQVKAGDTCATISQQWGISLSDFLFLNSGLNANCTNLWLNYSYCIEAVGSISTYPGYGGSTTMPPITGMSKTAVASPTWNITSQITVIPLANGTRTDCWDYVWINDTSQPYNCWDVGAFNGLSRDEFALWNPSIDQNSPNITTAPSYNYSCTLKPSVSYCVEQASPPPITPYMIATPTPVAINEAQNCTAWTMLPQNVTCGELLDDLRMTIAQLYALNPSIKSDCTGMTPDTYYCYSTSPDGSTPYDPSQYAGNGTANGTTSSGAPGPTQSGITPSCNAYAAAQKGDTCSAFASRNNITTSQLYAWNSVLGANGQNCSNSFWSGEAYCIGVSGGTSTSGGISASTTHPPTTTTSGAPGPTQSGIVSNCNAYAEAQKGDTCDAFATRNKISDAQLYAWNTVLGNSGQNCSNSFWANEYYCVGVSGSTAVSTTASPTTTSGAPGPTQSGIVSNCNGYAEAQSGDTCDAFASRNHISDSQLFTWNTVLGNNGQNCANSFWANEYYCISVSS